MSAEPDENGKWCIGILDPSNPLEPKKFAFDSEIERAAFMLGIQTAIQMVGGKTSLHDFQQPKTEAERKKMN